MRLGGLLLALRCPVGSSRISESRSGCAGKKFLHNLIAFYEPDPTIAAPLQVDVSFLLF
jgi:hypothetical protein